MCYYLTREKVVYINGYLGKPEDQVRPVAWQKRLYELITREALPVEKIICPHGLTKDSPLEMSYEALRQRVGAQ